MWNWGGERSRPCTILGGSSRPSKPFHGNSGLRRGRNQAVKGAASAHSICPCKLTLGGQRWRASEKLAREGNGVPRCLGPTPAYHTCPPTYHPLVGRSTLYCGGNPSRQISRPVRLVLSLFHQGQHGGSFPPCSNSKGRALPYQRDASSAPSLARHFGRCLPDII